MCDATSVLRCSPANERRILNGMLSILIHPERLGTAASLAAETEAYLDWLRRSPAPDGSAGVVLPGEPERRERQRCAREGISLDATTWDEIIAAASKVGLPRAACEALAADAVSL